MRAIAIIALISAAACAYAAEDIPLPKGWRFPTQQELADLERGDSKDKYARATADFNGDGVSDDAYLLKPTAFSGEGLWVRLSQKDKKPKWVLLDKIDWGPKYPSVDLAMGIKVIEPGTYPYICDESEKGCDIHSEDPSKRLKKVVPYRAIMHFRFGSAASLYFWDPGQAKFEHIWISD